MVKNPPSNAADIRDMGQSLGWKDALKEGTAPYISILIRRIPWTEEPGSIQSRGSQSDMTEHLSTKLLSIFPYARKNKLG